MNGGDSGECDLVFDSVAKEPFILCNFINNLLRFILYNYTFLYRQNRVIEIVFGCYYKKWNITDRVPYSRWGKWAKCYYTLSVTYKMLLTLSVTYTKCYLYQMLLIQSVTYTKCYLH